MFFYLRNRAYNCVNEENLYDPLQSDWIMRPHGVGKAQHEGMMFGDTYIHMRMHTYICVC